MEETLNQSEPISRFVSRVNKADLIVARFSKAFCFAAMGAVVFNMSVITYDVVRRLIIHSGFIGVNEYVVVVETILIFMGLAYTKNSNGLVHITFFMRRFPRSSPYIIWTINSYVATFIAILLSYASYLQYIMQSQILHGSTTSLQIPFYPFYFIMMIGFIGYSVAQGYGAAKATIGLFNREIRQQIIENWPA